MIDVEKVSKDIGSKQIFNDISLHCFAGETYILVGANGIGKTSLLKSILSLYTIDGGHITILGQNVDKRYKTNPDVGVFIDSARMLPHDTVKRSLIFFASLYDKSLEDIDYLISALRVEDELDKPYIALSSGNKRKLGLLISLINNPSLIIWDEPFASLDPEMCVELKELLITLKQNGKTVLLTTNDLFYTQDIYDRVGFFLDSKTIIQKTRKELQEEYPLKTLNEIYFLIKNNYINQ